MRTSALSHPVHCVRRMIPRALAAGFMVSLAFGPANAQNAVPNPGFEDYTSPCATGVQLDDIPPWSVPACAGFVATFHVCNGSGTSGYGVPANFLGYQVPHSGNAYCGIATYDPGAPGGNNQSYLNVDLLDTLEAGEEYCIRFWLSRADSLAYTTGELHAFLWYGPPSVCNSNDTAWDTYAACTFDISAVDDDDWHLIEGSFVANGAESNLTIGSFSFGPEIQLDSVGVPTWLNSLAGYYIDDIYLGSCDVGLAEQGATDLVWVYPNPVQRGEVVQIRWYAPTQRAIEVAVIDASGRNVIRTLEVATDGIVRVQMRGLNSGCYAISANDGSRTVRTKLVLE